MTTKLLGLDDVDLDRMTSLCLCVSMVSGSFMAVCVGIAIILD